MKTRLCSGQGTVRGGDRGLALLTGVALLALSHTPVAQAGPYNPGLARQAVYGITPAPRFDGRLALGLRVTVPFAGHGPRAGPVRLSFGLSMERPAMFAGLAAAFDPLAGRPIAQLRWSPQPGPDFLSFNGLPLRGGVGSTLVLAAAQGAEGAGAAAQDPQGGTTAKPEGAGNKDGGKKKKSKAGRIIMWTLLGTVAFVGVGAVIVATSSIEVPIPEFSFETPPPS